MNFAGFPWSLEGVQAQVRPLGFPNSSASGYWHIAGHDKGQVDQNARP